MMVSTSISPRHPETNLSDSLHAEWVSLICSGMPNGANESNLSASAATFCIWMPCKQAQKNPSVLFVFYPYMMSRFVQPRTSYRTDCDPLYWTKTMCFLASFWKLWYQINALFPHISDQIWVSWKCSHSNGSLHSLWCIYSTFRSRICLESVKKVVKYLDFGDEALRSRKLENKLGNIPFNW